MQRRELISMIAAVTGVAFVGTDALFAAGGARSKLKYSDSDIQLFDDVAETILPRTDTPGAKDAAVGRFIARYSAACYEPAHIAILRNGIGDINGRMKELHGVNFSRAGEQEKRLLLTMIDTEAKQYAQPRGSPTDDKPPHYFSLLKQLTLLGFFTSEPGATRVARYRPVPGRYKGCTPYNKGETFWAW
jgi:glucoside 3-dehydrogenase (cytochrome c) hitch-hiker subunit